LPASGRGDAVFEVSTVLSGRTSQKKRRSALPLRSNLEITLEAASI